MRLNELKRILIEADLETKTAEDLWSEQGDDTEDYVSTMTYQVRPIKGSKPLVYEVFSIITGASSTPYGKFSAAGLARTLVPIRPNQTPDVEGFTVYTDPTKVEAFKYDGDPIMLDLDGSETVQLNKSDYVIRAVKGASFKYSTEIEGTFDATLKKA